MRRRQVPIPPYLVHMTDQRFARSAAKHRAAAQNPDLSITQRWKHRRKARWCERAAGG